MLHFWDSEPGPTTTDLGVSVVRLGSITGLTTQAEAGTTPTSSIEIDDPAGSLSFIGLWRFYVTETACPAGKQMLWNGYKRARRVRRGDAKRGSLRTGAARMWTVDLVDVNSLLDRDIIQGAADAAHGKRPAETDVARITWLLSSSFMNHIHDNGLFSTSAPLNMDACDYRGQYGGDILRDCSVQSGKNFYAYYDEASGQDSLFYDDPNSAAYDSGKFLSNVLSEIDNSTTFGLLDDWELARDPSKVYAGALVPYSGGSTYRYSSAVAAAFYTRDGTAPNPNISTLAAAQAAGDRFIADSATEDDRLTGRVKIPAAHVNDIYAGMLVSFKATHLPGYATTQVCRVITRSVAQDEESDQFYNVHLELSPTTLTGFHQLVLSGRYGVGVGANGTYQAVWNGASGGISLPTPAIIQDTDGYTGTAGDMQAVSSVATWTIPTGFHGTYNVGWELINIINAWWMTIPPGGSPNPQQVPYIYAGGDNSCGAEVAAAATVTYAFRANGVTLASAVATHSGGLGYWIPSVHLAPTPVVLHDGDVLDFAITFAGTNYFNAIEAVYGLTVYGGQQGVLVMTFDHA